VGIFDASKYEGLAPELAEKIGADVNGAYEAARLSFKEKMDRLDAKLKAEAERAAAFEGVDPNEIPVLRKAKGDAAELSAALEKHRADYQAKEAALAEMRAKLERLDFQRNIEHAIRQYNTANPALAVREDAADLIEILAQQRLKQADGKQIFTDAAGTPIMRGDSFGGPDAFIEALRKEKPSLFNAPTGSGATGSKSAGSAKVMKRTDFESLGKEEKMRIAISGVSFVD
jgi:hypothetical protein